MIATATARWTGRCYDCRREEVAVETRYSHAAKALCDTCASRPHRPPQARADDFVIRAPASSPARPDMTRLQGIAAALRAEGLRAVVDPDLATVRTDCPTCHAGASDPQQIWLPLQIIPRQRGAARARCDACGAVSNV